MQITGMLQRLESGDRDALDDVIPMVYQELKKLAKAHVRREAMPVFEPTALVHEAFLRLARGRHPFYENRTHFYGIASRLMRQVLVETARSRARQKRGAAREMPLSEVRDRGLDPDRSVLAIEAALQQLERADPRESTTRSNAVFRRLNRRGVGRGAFHPRACGATRVTDSRGLAAQGDDCRPGLIEIGPQRPEASGPYFCPGLALFSLVGGTIPFSRM